MKSSIKNKIFISFLMLNTVVFMILVLLTLQLFQRNNNEFIQYDLIKTQRDAKAYITQFVDNNKIGLSNTIDEQKVLLLKALNSGLGVKGVFYDTRGNICCGSEKDSDVFSKENKDLQLALEGKASCTIFQEQRVAAFSMPVTIGGKTLWTYRLIKDYTPIFNNSRNLARIIVISGAASLVLIFFVSLFIAQTITRPIIKLKEYTNKIAMKDYDVNIEMEADDEVGDLSHNFKIMHQRITEHINTIEKDKELLSELLTQRKRFFDSVTHELKTPLTTIQGYTQMLAHNGFEDKDFFDKGTTHILEESIRLHKLVLSLLELSEQNSLDIKMQSTEFDISTLLEKVCDSLEIKAQQNNISIEKDIRPRLMAYGSMDDIRGIFINLIDNAIKYAGEKSIITVGAIDKNGTIEVVVSDNGIGIPQHSLDKIFEPFYRVDSKKSRTLGGSGLGLSIVKNIVENHGGSIHIESTEGKGTKIIIILPANKATS